MILYCVLGQRKNLTDLLVGATAGNPLHNLQLPLSEVSTPFALCEEQGNLWRKVLFPCSDLTDGGEKVVAVFVF